MRDRDALDSGDAGIMAKVLRWALPALCAVGAPMLLGGCLGLEDRSVARAGPVDFQAADASGGTQPPIRTVRRAGTQVADAEDASSGGALPTPRQIFDFHPPGSKPDGWRQPFVIDPNDGPLAGYVRRMDAELTESNKQVHAAAVVPPRKKVCPSTGPTGTISATCGENETAGALAR